jgi:hypothetical protein
MTMTLATNIKNSNGINNKITIDSNVCSFLFEEKANKIDIYTINDRVYQKNIIKQIMRLVNDSKTDRKIKNQIQDFLDFIHIVIKNDSDIFFSLRKKDEIDIKTKITK